MSIMLNKCGAAAPLKTCFAGPALLASWLNWLAELFPSQQSFDVAAESLQVRDHLVCGFDFFLLMNEQLASTALDQRAETFSHAAADVAKDLEAVRSGNKKRDVAGTQDANGFGKAFEGFQFKTGHVQALELFGGVRHGFSRESILTESRAVPEDTHRPQGSLARLGIKKQLRLEQNPITSCTGCPGPRRSGPPATCADRRERRGRRRCWRLWSF